jgi:hypothetical protein
MRSLASTGALCEKYDGIVQWSSKYSSGAMEDDVSKKYIKKT